MPRRRSASVPPAFRHAFRRRRSAPVLYPFRRRSAGVPHRCRTGAAPVPHRYRRRSAARSGSAWVPANSPEGGKIVGCAPSTVRPLARDPRVLIGWPFPLGFGLDGRLLLARRGRVYI